jgi:uroporphyrinogen III methyltransferase/synthase
LTGSAPSGPLAGVAIAWTGSPNGAKRLLGAAEAAGARVERLPLITFHGPEDPSAVARVLASLEEYAWIVFTSQEAVRRTETWPRPVAKIAAVGRATADELARRGWPVEMTPQKESAAGLADAFEALSPPRAPVLFVRGNKALPTIPTRLRAAGYRVDEVAVYDTTPVPEARAREVVARIRETADVVVMGSPSGVCALQGGLSGEPLDAIRADIRWVALGPTTRAAMLGAGAGRVHQLEQVSKEAFCSLISDIL